MKTIVRVCIVFFGVAVFSMISKNGFGQTEYWTKISTEIALSFEKNPFEVRWRPDDHIFLPKKYLASFADKNNAARTDLMLGVGLGAFKIYNYSKFDEFGQIWTGIRFDYNFALLNKKLLFNIQERYFWALTSKADDHYYLIQFIRYAIVKNIQAGVLSYGKWKPDKPFDTGQWFMGPTVNFDLPWHLNLNLAYTNDVFHNYAYMIYLKAGYKIVVKKKTETYTE